MKRVVVRVSDNYELERAKSAILAKFSYLTFVQKFRSFGILTFDVAEGKEDEAIIGLDSLHYVTRVTWDGEKFSCNPVETATLTVDTDGDAEAVEEAQGDATRSTRNITTAGSGTVYVQVQNISGNNYFVLGLNPSGPFARYSNFTGFLQGGTYTFDTSDSSNTGHPFRFSETPDGTHTGGVESTAGVTVNGTPGQAGSYTRITIGNTVPSILYYYCSTHSGMGRYQTSPNRYGTINVHDMWHLDRITKQDRQYLNRQFSYTEDGDGVDIYVIDSGVRGASRPTGTNASLHPELFDPDNVADLNGLSEQQNYRVYELSHFSGLGSTNEDDNGHGTYCAILSAGRTAGVSRKAKIYALKAFNSSLSGTYTDILSAYQAVIDHNDPADANYKGDTRPAIINSSFGPTIPSGSYPYVELNDAGNDTGTDEEMLDDIESTIVGTYNVMISRSAGNGFIDSSSEFAGPLQTRMVAGARTAGYSDGDVNTVDVNQNKITVGATEYNDRWADFSNYGSGCTTVAPGANILLPEWNWTTNTSYTSTANYDTINGTSFSCPIVTGILASWTAANGYTRATNGLTGLSKSFIRTTGPTGDIIKGTHSLYPVNSIEERRLPDNPFEFNSGSNFVLISFNSADASHFLGNVGSKVQLRTGSTSLIIAGINLGTEASNGWFTIQAESAVNNTITIQTANTPINTTTGGGTNNYLALIKEDELTHESIDGVVFSGTTLRSQTDAQEAQGTGSYTNIKYYPVDSGVDFDLSSTASVKTVNRGAFYPYIDVVTTFATPSGDVSSGGFANGATVNIDLGLSTATTFANEPFYERYTVTGDNITASGLSVGATTGVLSGTVTSDYIDTTFNFTVTETNTNVSRNYSFTTTGTGVLVTITQQPSDDSVESGSGGTATFGPVSGTSSDASTITFQWEVSTNSGASWSNVSNGGGYSGATTNTLTVDDDFTKNGYQFRCVLDTATAVSPSTTNAVTLTVFRTITISNQPTNQFPVAPAPATFSVTASTLDAAALAYQWQTSEDNVSYTPISGATNASYTTGTTSYDNDFGDYYRCVISVSGATDVTSSAARNLVTRTITVTTQPVNETGSVGGTRTFTTAGTTSDNDAGDITFQWQFSIDSGANWSNVTDGTGETTDTYTTATLTGTEDGYQYRCLLSAPGATTTPTNAATLQVETVTPVVVTQPQNATVNENATATFTTLGDVTLTPIGGNAASSSFDTESWVTPSGGGGNEAGTGPGLGLMSDHEPSVTYQWERSDNGGSTWTAIVGATSPSYTTGTLTYADDNGDLYRCEIDAVGAVSPAYTNNATLTVQRTFTIDSQPANQTGNEGGTATFSVTTSSSSGTPTYQWRRSDDGGANYADVVGATNPSYTTPVLVYSDDNDDRYLCRVSLVGSAGDIDSSFALLSVLRVITITAQPQSTSVIEGNQAVFTIGATITSDVVSYQWQKSTDGGSNWNNINGANGASYTTPATVFPTTPSEQFRCVLSNVAATSVTSAVATLTVNESEFVSAPATVTPVIDPDTNLTFNRTPVINTSAFVPEYTGSTHFSSFWRIRRVSDNVTVYDTSGTFANGDTGNLTSFTVPGGTLDFNTTYNVQVKFRDNAGLESAYTAAVNFTTPIVDQPEIQTITPAFNPTINVDPAQIINGYVHTSSDWQFSGANTFTTIVHQSLGNSVNLTSYTLPGGVTLDPNTTYYVRIRFNVNPS
jgi:hypothetical protein